MVKKPYKLVFFGTSDFAVPSLHRLAKDPDFSILEVVTQPDRAVGRNRTLTGPAVKRAAVTLSLKVHQPESIRGDEALTHFKNLGADVFVVVSYGNILPKDLLNLPPKGGVNVHASLLPSYRGASPISAAIAAGEEVTGITIMKMNEKVDEGPTMATRNVAVGEEDTTGTLSVKLSEAASEMLCPTLKLYIEGGIEPKPQNEALASMTHILERVDGKIDWSKSAVEIERFIRAMQPWPEAFTHWVREGKPAIKMTIKHAGVLHPTSKCDTAGKPGTVCKLADGTVGVNCGTGSLLLEKVQLESKNPSDVRDFLNGYPDFIGAQFI